MKKDCLDLPPKLPTVSMSAAMKPDTWKLYKEMREETTPTPPLPRRVFESCVWRR
jgi:hypothetical protein